MKTETRAKISAALKGNKNSLGHHHTAEAKAKVSAAMKGNKHGLGHPCSEEKKAKIAAANRINSAGKHPSEETRAKMSAALKGNKRTFGHHPTAETRAKMSAALKGNKNSLGHHHTAEVRAKMSAAHKGSHRSEETRAKMSAAHKGHPSCLKGRHLHTAEARAEISNRMKGNKHCLGRHLSEEAKARIGTANAINMKGKHPSEETRAKMSAALSGPKNPFYGKHHSDEIFRKILLTRQLKPTKQELRLKSILDKHFPGEWEFVGDGKVIIEGLCPDFININGKKAIIEHFGDYWHTKRGTSWRNTELGRVAAFDSYGFKCLVLWGHELKNEQNVVKKVEQFMKAIK